jgi:hypothetical protein
MISDPSSFPNFCGIISRQNKPLYFLDHPYVRGNVWGGLLHKHKSFPAFIPDKLCNTFCIMHLA